MGRPEIETFPNPRPERDYEIDIRCPEFTSVCPKTGLPDFGEIRITYTPGPRCIELKALKYYLLDFRNKGIFYEAVTNQILDDLVAVCAPKRMTVIGDFSARGGIKTLVQATYTQPADAQPRASARPRDGSGRRDDEPRRSTSLNATRLKATSLKRSGSPIEPVLDLHSFAPATSRRWSTNTSPPRTPPACAKCA